MTPFSAKTTTLGKPTRRWLSPLRSPPVSPERLENESLPCARRAGGGDPCARRGRSSAAADASGPEGCLSRLAASPVHSEQVPLRAAAFVHPAEPLGVHPGSAQRCTRDVQVRPGNSGGPGRLEQTQVYPISVGGGGYRGNTSNVAHSRGKTADVATVAGMAHGPRSLRGTAGYSSGVSDEIKNFKLHRAIGMAYSLFKINLTR
ncbi:hypothetical protein F2P81_018777 [Scophthalmus maximus]|uniref:Uncharacterized protein n=1 Tax=Scophthalmus maximus TaxID=52904 RepID=A0A6A4SH20_SCOMX|nr:hypothetical protein F2P81_018777 [Scophthalmus maximus]